MSAFLDYSKFGNAQGKVNKEISKILGKMCREASEED
jgi:hypothetical protein